MSKTRVKRKGEKTVVYLDGQQLQGSGTNITVSCGQSASQSRGTVYQMPNGGTETTRMSCMGSAGSSCRTTLSMENTDQPQVLRVVPKKTTIILEEVNPPLKAQKSGSAASGRSKQEAIRKGSPTIQVVQECENSSDYYPPPPSSRPEPVAAEHCVECLAELIERRRAGRRGGEDETEVRVATRVVDEKVSVARKSGAGGRCCPCCGAPCARR